MDPIDNHDRMRAARRRMRAQRQKAGELRGRVVAISLLCFAILWGIVFVQMATGNDPVLGNPSPGTARVGGHRDRAGSTLETGAGAASEEPESTGGYDAEVEGLYEEPAEEESPAEEPVEEEFFEEPAPVTTSQS
jgi:hypothetical protein